MTTRIYNKKNSDKVAVKRSSKSIKLQDNYKKCILIRKRLHLNNSNSDSLQLIALVDTRDRLRSPDTLNEQTPNSTLRSSSR